MTNSIISWDISKGQFETFQHGKLNEIEETPDSESCKIETRNLDDSSPRIDSKNLEESFNISVPQIDRQLSGYNEKVNFCVSSQSSDKEFKLGHQKFLKSKDAQAKEKP